MEYEKEELRNLFIGLLELLEVYFGKMNSDDDLINKTDFFRILSSLLIDLFTNEECPISDPRLIDLFVNLYYKIGSPLLKESYLYDVLLMWEIWDNLPSDLFDNYCIQLSEVIISADDKIEQKSLLSSI